MCKCTKYILNMSFFYTCVRIKPFNFSCFPIWNLRLPSHEKSIMAFHNIYYLLLFIYFIIVTCIYFTKTINIANIKNTQPFIGLISHFETTSKNKML